MLYVTGPTLCQLMRRHQITIRLLAQRLAIPMDRVRRRRREGITDRHVARDWLEAITGRDPGMLLGPVEAIRHGKTHYRRRIRGRPHETWMHCGLRQGHATEALACVTCKRCLAYIAKGLAYGYRDHHPDAPVGWMQE